MFLCTSVSRTQVCNILEELSETVLAATTTEDSMRKIIFRNGAYCNASLPIFESVSRILRDGQ
jgi:hypothetical protein